MHKRRTIINAVKTQLQTLDVGGVWNQRTPPTRNVWPCITLYAEEEPIEVAPTHDYPIQPRSQDRYLNLVIKVWIKAEQDAEKIEEDMDTWSENVETTVVNTFGAADLVMTLTEFDVSEDDPKINTIALTYNVKYYTTEQNPS